MIKTLKNCIREYKRSSILSIVFISLEVILEVVIPLIMAYLIDEGINKSNEYVVLNAGILLLFVSVLSLISGIKAGKYSAEASCGFAKNIRHDMYYKIQEYSFKNIDKFSASSIITRLTTDVSNVTNAYQMIIRIAFRAPLMFIFSLIMTFIINKKIALIFLVIIPILGFILFFIADKAKPKFKSVFETYDELNNDVEENVRSIRVVKSFVREDYEKNKFKKISNLIYERFCNAEKIISYTYPTMQLSIYITILLVSWLGANLIVNNNLTTGELTSLISYSSTILSSLMMLSMIYVMCTMAITSGERISEILNEEVDIKNNDNPIYEVKDGSIEFKNVYFSYVKDKEYSLKNINLSIKSGESIGIIGGTGSSKTTLISLISRLYDTTKGSVLVGGVDVKDYDIKTLRDNVSVVLQKNVLFSGTIIDNLRWGKKDATLDEIKEVAKISCADEFIMKNKDGYNKYIEQGGTNVSGGQKQRLCIARALLKSPKILILDDSTSAVDTKTDAIINNGLKEYLPNTTKIVIAQRISSVENLDRVIVLDEGKIVDFDTPSNLLKNNKIYKEVYNSQKKGVSNE